jgi:dihydrofolate synthase/folylpolyglutamate synthase
VEPVAYVGVPLRAPGHFQRRNFALAAAAAEAFLEHPLEKDAVERAGAETRIPGRLDVVDHRPLTVYDGAHNPEGARALADSLDDLLGDRRPRVAVIGVLEDKDAAGMLEALLPHVDRAVFTRSSNPRSLRRGRPSETGAGPFAGLDRARELRIPAYVKSQIPAICGNPRMHARMPAGLRT